MEDLDIELTVVAESDELLERVFGKCRNDVHSGDAAEIAQGAVLKLTDYEPTRRFGLHEIFTFTLTVAAGVSSRLISSWLMERMKRHAVSVKIDEKPSPLTQEGLERELKEVLGSSHQAKTERGQQ